MVCVFSEQLVVQSSALQILNDEPCNILIIKLLYRLLWAVGSQKIPDFYGTEKFITVYVKFRHWTLFWVVFLLRILEVTASIPESETGCPEWGFFVLFLSSWQADTRSLPW